MRTLAVLVAVLGASPAVSAADTYTGPPVLTTTGEAALNVAPNRAFVRIATEGRAPAAKDAQRTDAEAMTAVRTQLHQLGLADDAVRTISYDLQLEFDYTGGKQIPRGYVARHTIELRVDDVDKLGEIVARAVGAGAGSVAGIRFDVKERDQLERDALRKAVEDARARADAAAAGAGATVGGIIRIEEQRTFEPPRPVAMARGMAAEAVATPIAPGEIEIRSSVSLTTSLK
jgi:uncharacterized protein YggE